MNQTPTAIPAACNDEPISLVICSADRQTGNSYYQGTIPLKTPIHGCRKVYVHSSNIPNTAYVLNGVPFVFQESAGAAPTYTLTLTGSYTGNSLALYLQTAMMAASAAANTYLYTVTYDTDLGKMTYAENTGLRTFRILSSTSGFPTYKLGFTTTNTAYAVTHTTPNIIDLSPPKYALVRLSGMQKAGQVHTSGDDSVGHFILPIGGHSFDIGEYYAKSMYDSYIRISKYESVTAFAYSIYDVETKALMPLQANWIIQLYVK